MSTSKPTSTLVNILFIRLMTTEDVGVVLFCIICVYGKEERINSVSHINPLFLNAVSQKRIHVITQSDNIDITTE